MGVKQTQGHRDNGLLAACSSTPAADLIGPQNKIRVQSRKYISVHSLTIITYVSIPMATTYQHGVIKTNA